MELSEIFLWIFLGLMIVILIKNQVTFSMHMKISKAIYDHHMECIDKYDFDALCAVDYEDEEAYEATLFRLWDWGYKRILPPEKFEIIKPYIK